MNTVDDSGIPQINVDIDLETQPVSLPPMEPVVTEEVEVGSKETAIPTVEMNYSVYSPYVGESEPLLSLPPDTYSETKKFLDSLPQIEHDPEWQQIAKNGMEVSINKGHLDDLPNREDSLFRQSVKTKTNELFAGAPKFTDQVSSKLTGEAAILRMRSLMGMGSIVQIPLWHSGFWISIKAPEEAAHLELERRLAEEKITLGRTTHGFIFSNMSVALDGYLTDFILAHVYDTTLGPDVTGDIRSLISQLDMPTMIWGMACAIWPNGFPYSRSILNKNDPSQSRIIRENVSVGRLLWVDNRAFTEWQLNHMGQRFGKTMTIDSLKRYKNEFTRGSNKSITITDKIKMTLKVSSLQDHLVDGMRWINNIVSMVDRAFGVSQNDAERNEFIYTNGRASGMCLYSHLVENITLDDKHIIADRETIESLLKTMSADTKAFKTFFEEVRKFITESIISVIAVPSISEEEDAQALPNHPHLVPLDMASVFFVQQVQIKQRILERE